MSTAWKGGSTRAHRRWRAVVLQRDGHLCQWPEADGSLCLAAATHADHVVPLSEGGAALDLGNGRALCVRHNTSDGARRGNTARGRGTARPPVRSWSP